MNTTSLAEYRQRRQAARAWHPSVREVITVDAIATAQASHAELRNAERGVAVDQHPERSAPRYCQRCGRSWLVVTISPDGVCTSCRRRERANPPVTAPEVGSKSRLFSVSRERRARWMDRLAVALLLALAAALGCIAVLASAPKAKADEADPSPAVISYTNRYGLAVCTTLDDHHTVSGVLGVLLAIQEADWTPFEAGQIVGLSVQEFCPRNERLLERFVDIYGGAGQTA